MISDHCFTREWLDGFKKWKDHSRIDTIILEKMIYALHLLERLKAHGLEFVFKGGTSLLLLLDEGNRFSIDIDIICATDRVELEAILQNVVDASHFTSFALEQHRSYLPGVPKAHYKFSFPSNMQGSGSILLDVLIEKSLYPALIQRPVRTKWIQSDEETFVTVPSIDSITGDKLTAFAPNTIGIPYFKGKDGQSYSMEICKQLFDLGKLFDRIEDVRTVAASFHAFAENEIEYRKLVNPETGLTPRAVLQDTINTCLIIAKRGSGSVEEKTKFAEIQKGIRAFGTGFLLSGTFRIDDAVASSARVAHLATKIQVSDLDPIPYYHGQDTVSLNIDDPKWSFLNRLNRLPDKSSFYYWYRTVQLLTPERNF